MPRQSKSVADDRLLAAIDAAEERSYGSENDSELATDRQLALQRYLGRNINPAPEGRSQVRDRTTFEVVEWTKPSLLRIFCSTDEVAKFEPQGPEDEAASQQESDYVNFVVTQRNPWLQICHDWFHDALVTKNGYTYAYWDTTKSVETETYENLSDDAAALLLQDEAVEVVGHEQVPDEVQDAQNAQAFQRAMMQYQQQTQMAVAQGANPQQLPPPPQPPQPTFLHTIQIKRTKERGCVKIDVLAPERCKIDISTRNFTLDGCNYFEFYDFQTLGSLRAAGFKVDDDIGDAGDDEDRNTIEDQARDLYNEQSSWSFGQRPDDASMRQVKVRRVWIRHDYDGDGIDEMHYVVLVGDTILHREECADLPISSITPIPMPHRHVGMSLADTVADIEDISTNITRGAIDNLNLSNTPRMAASDRVNMSDLLDVRVGGVIRVDGQPPQELMPVMTPDVFPSAVNALAFFDSRRQNRTGINAYFQGTDANALNKTASGISQLTNSAAQRVELIARLFSHGVARLFLIVHRLTLQHGRRAETVKLRNQWVTVNPSEWRYRTDLKITVGLGTGSKEGQLAMLGQVFATQMQTIPLGTATPDNIYKTLIEMAKAAGFSNAEAFFTDPQGKPLQPPPDPALEKAKLDAQVKMQTEQVAAQKEAQMAQMKAQFDAAMLKQKQEFDAWKVQFEAGTQIQLEQMKLEGSKEVEGAKLTLQAQSKQADIEMQRTQMEREDSKEDEAEQEDMDVKSALQSISEAVMSLQQSTARKPRGIERIRDGSGRLVGARKLYDDGTSEDITIQ